MLCATIISLCCLRRYLERGGISKGGIRYLPTLTEVQKNGRITVESILQWFESLLSALDSYCWLIGSKYLNTELLLKGAVFVLLHISVITLNFRGIVTVNLKIKYQVCFFN